MKRKHNKTLLFGLVAAMLVIVGVALMGANNLLPFSFPGLGATVLSISDVRVVSDSPELGGDTAFLVNLVANRGGENLTGEITPEDVKRYGVTTIPAGRFKITLELLTMDYKYKFYDDDTVLYKVYESTVSDGCLRNPVPYDKVSLETTRQNAAGTWSDPQGVAVSPAVFGKPPEGGDINRMIELGEWGYWMPEERWHDGPGECIHIDAWQRGDWYATNLGGVPYARGYLIDTQAFINYKVRVTVRKEDSDETISAVLDPGHTVANLGDIGRVKWVGGLVAAQFPPIPAVDYAIVQGLEGTPYEEQYKFVPKNRYWNYKNTLFELSNLDYDYFTFQNVDPGVGAGPIVDKQNTLNNELGAMYAYSKKPKSCTIDADSQTVTCTTESDVIYPELQLLIKASWLGIEVQNGMPELASIKVPDTVYEGEVGQLKFKVKNTGDYEDSFDITLTSEDATLSLGSKRVSLKPGQSEDEYISFSGHRGTYNATLRATSVNNPFAKTEKQVTITIVEKPLPEEIQRLPGELEGIRGDINALTSLFGELGRLLVYALIGIGGLLVVVLVAVLVRRRSS